MRKTLMGGLAAALATGVAGVAIAQTPPSATINVKVTPSKSGTAKKPKTERVALTIKNNAEAKTTAAQIDIFFPKQLKLSTAGLKTCDLKKLTKNGPKACPTASKAGVGSATALVNPQAPAPLEIKFNVTTFVGAKSKLYFYLQQQGGGIAQPLVGAISKASGAYGQKLVIKIPGNLQQPAPGVYSALKQIQNSLSLRNGSHFLISSTGCPANKSWQYKVTLHYVPNPTPPAAKSVSALGSAACSR